MENKLAEPLELSNGDQMPAIGLGTWKSAPAVMGQTLAAAVRLGYRHIDCAPIYGNEPQIGAALSGIFEDGVVSREEMFITTKLWNDAHHPSSVRPSLEKSLSDLKLDYVDLFLIHWPVAAEKGVYVPKTAADLISLERLPLLDTWDAMERLVEKGLCRHIGVANFSVPKLQGLLKSARIKPEVNQVELHPYLQQASLIEFCKDNGVHVTAYSPLGSKDRPIGLKAPNEPILLKDPVIDAIALQHDATPAQILISWALHRGNAVIPKSVNPDRLAENLDAAKIKLTFSDLRRIASLEKNRRYLLGDFFAVEGGPYTVSSLWDI